MWTGAGTSREPADSGRGEESVLTSTDGLHARLEQDSLLDLQDAALVFFHDLQSLVDNW